MTWRTFWHALFADEDQISAKKPILLLFQASAQSAFKCALVSLITGKDYAAYARDESVETRKLRNNAIIAMQAEREQHLERKQAIEDKLEERKNRTFPKGNFNPLDEYPKTFWPRMGTNLLDFLGACAFPRLKDARFPRELFDAVINGKTKAREGQGYRWLSTPLSCSLSGKTSPPRTPHTTLAYSSSTPLLLGLDDPQLDHELQKARETIPAALYDYPALEQDGGQMSIADNSKFMPDIEPLKKRCKLIAFT